MILLWEIGKFLLNAFDWITKTSLLAALGGMKGVNEAHRIIIEALNSSLIKNYPFQIKNQQLSDFANPETA